MIDWSCAINADNDANECRPLWRPFRKKKKKETRKRSCRLMQSYLLPRLTQGKLLVVLVNAVDVALEQAKCGI